MAPFCQKLLLGTLLNEYEVGFETFQILQRLTSGAAPIETEDAERAHLGILPDEKTTFFRENEESENHGYP